MLVDEYDDEDVIDIRHYYDVINKDKWGIIGLAFVVTLLSVLVVLNLTPIYRATATLLIENQSGKLVSIDELYGLDTGNRNYYQTQVSILESRQLAASVIGSSNMDFTSYPEFNPNLVVQEPPFWEDFLPFLAKKVEPLTGEKLDRHMVKVLSGNLTVQPVRGTDLIRINFDSPNSQLATNISNLVGETYIESQLEARLQLTQKAAMWLTERLDSLRIKLSASEMELQDFQEKERLVESGTSGVRSLSLNELNQISNDLVVARKTRIETGRIYQQVLSSQAISRDSLMTHPSIVVEPGVVTSKETQDIVDRKVLELSERYGSKHPKMVAVIAEQKAARNQLNRQIDNAVKRLKESFDAAVATEKNLERNELRSRGDIQGLRRKEFRFAELQRNVETDRQLYNTFFTRFKETDATQGLQAANARISDPAIEPESPIKPNKRLIVGGVFLFTVLFGIGLAFLRDYLDNTIKSGREVEEKLGLALLGLLPLIKAKSTAHKNRHSQHYLDPNQVGFAEAIRTVRTSVLLASLDSPHKVIVVTSSIPGEGKTTVAYNLAIALGQMEKVLLIDADMRRPSVAGDTGLSNQHAGLSNFVAGGATLEESVYVMEEYGIDVMPAGLIPPNPLELLSSQKFKDTLTDLQVRYDRIIIDSAPCQAVSDSLVISSSADAMIYVVKAEATSQQLVSSALSRLRRVGAPLIGVVLNQFNAEHAAKYGGYNSGYYDYYGSDK